ncbi:MAG: efflux RND transporter periplasmic adaptor subunit [Polyangiaceae bacterium]
MANTEAAPIGAKTAKKTRIRRALTWGGLALLGASAALAGPRLATEDGPEPPPDRSSRKVRVAEVVAADAPGGARYAGTLRAAQRAVLAFQLGGRVAARPVHIGDTVKAGQVLARLDARELANAASAARADLDQTQARLEQQTRDRARAVQLWKQGAISTQESEVATSQLNVLKASSRSMEVRSRDARRRLGETVLRAPFAGVVAAVHRERGETVSPGTPIVELSGDDRLEVELQVPEQTLAQLEPAATVRVDLPLVGKRGLEATVRHIGRAASGSGRLFPVIVELDDAPGLRAGMTAEVVLGLRPSHALSLPVAAIRDPSGSSPTVLRVSADRVQVVPLTLRDLRGDSVTVEGNLQVGDRVVVAGHAFLLDGDRVQVAP